MPNRSRPPFWRTYASADDELRSSVEDSIETVEDAQWYRKKNLTTLRKCEGEEALVHDIEQCSETRPCRRVLCPLCARLYRIWFAEETIRWLHRSKRHRRPAKTLVVRLEQASNRDLPMVSIGRLQDQLRKRLLRAGIFYVIGGTEVSYNAKDNKWTAHFHLLIFGASDAALKNFAQKCKTDGNPTRRRRTERTEKSGRANYLPPKILHVLSDWRFRRPREGTGNSNEARPIGGAREMDGDSPLRALSVPGWISAKCRWNPAHKKASSVATKHTPAPAINKIGGRKLAVQRI